MSSVVSSALRSGPSSYDALLLVSFGGPEGPDDVLPFLENVVRGKNVPRQRLSEVARRYDLFDGISPLNAQNRVLLAALVAELNAYGPHLPVYWGNRNWHPLLPDAIRQMADDGVQRALALVTSAFGSYRAVASTLTTLNWLGRRLAPRRRKSRSSGCSTIIRASSNRRPTELPPRWIRFRPSAAGPRG